MVLPKYTSLKIMNGRKIFQWMCLARHLCRGIRLIFQSAAAVIFRPFHKPRKFACHPRAREGILSSIKQTLLLLDSLLSSPLPLHYYSAGSTSGQVKLLSRATSRLNWVVPPFVRVNDILTRDGLNKHVLSSNPFVVRILLFKREDMWHQKMRSELL